MPLIDIRAFSGMRPALAPHLLEQTEAQMVRGADLAAGELRPMRLPALELQTEGEVRSLWLHEQTWRVYADRRRFAESPAAGNARLYSSREEGGLRGQAIDGEEYALGLTPPDAVPHIAGPPMTRTATVHWRANGFTLDSLTLFPDDKVSFTGSVPSGLSADTPYVVLACVDEVYSIAATDAPTVALTFAGEGDGALRVEDADVTVDRAYVFTVVNAFGEESAPSLPSANIRMNAARAVTLGGMDYARQGDEAPITAKRVYRTATGTESTDYLFVAEIDPDAAMFTDALADAELAEVLPSAHWDQPSETLRHLTELPGGILAAHDGEQVHLCEAYRPYAWPEANRFAVRGRIAALAASGRTLFALTDSSAHALTVESPSEVYTTTLDGYAPCLGVDGVAATPFGVLFPSNDGLYLAAQGATSPQNATEGLLGESDWRELNPASFLSAYFDTTYMAFFERLDGTRGTLLLDFGRDNQAKMRLLDAWGTALQVIPSMRRVYMAQQTGRTNGWRVCRMFASAHTDILAWRSKRFFLPSRVNMAALLVDGDAVDVDEKAAPDEMTFWGGCIAAQMCAETPFGGEQSDRRPGGAAPVTGMIRIFGDGKERVVAPIRPGRLVPLPASYTAGMYEVEVTSQLPVRRVAIATTTGEIQR